MTAKENNTGKTKMVITSQNDDSIKTIYLVKYREIYHRPNSMMTSDNTYTLFTFEDLDSAKEYLDSAYNVIVKQNVRLGEFSVMFERIETDSKDERIILQKLAKLIGANERHNSHTKFYTFTIEKINLKINV